MSVGRDKKVKLKMEIKWKNIISTFLLYRYQFLLFISINYWNTFDIHYSIIHLFELTMNKCYNVNSVSRFCFLSCKLKQESQRKNIPLLHANYAFVIKLERELVFPRSQIIIPGEYINKLHWTKKLTIFLVHIILLLYYFFL